MNFVCVDIYFSVEIIFYFVSKFGWGIVVYIGWVDSVYKSFSIFFVRSEDNICVVGIVGVDVVDSFV